MLESEGWEVLERRLKSRWISAANRLIKEKDPAKLERRQAEVQILERVLSLPHRLLEKPESEYYEDEV